MNILNEDCLSLLPPDLIKKAGSMSKAYQYLYCIENLMRLYIDEHPARNAASIPIGCKKIIDGRKKEESKHTWTSFRVASDLYYLDFKDLLGFLINNWPLFEADFPSQTWIAGKLEDLARCRNLIAHNSYLTKEEQDLIMVQFNQITRQIAHNKLKLPDKRLDIPQPESFFVEGFKRSVLWTNQQASDGAEFRLEYPASLEVAPLMLQAFFSQTSIAFKIIYENAQIYLPVYFEIGRRQDIPEERWFKDHVLFQVGQYDIDQDGIDELFVCINNEEESQEAGLEIKVFKYYPPAFRQHAFRPENWQLIGDFSFQSIVGRQKAFIKDASIKVPRNFRGFYRQWTFVEGKFRETGDW